MYKNVFLVGRNPIISDGETPIIINDPGSTVSNTHCKIIVEQNRLFIKDLDSLNGTYVNGQKINGITEVTTDNEIQIGKDIFLNLNNEPILNALNTPDIFQQQQQQQQQQQELVNENVKYDDSLEYRGREAYQFSSLATFGDRFLACMIDGFILGIMIGVVSFITNILLPAYTMFGVNPINILLQFIIMIAVFIAAIYFYYVEPISRTGQTIGRKVMDITYLDEQSQKFPSKGQIWIRMTIGYFISSLILCIGFLMMLGDDKRQTLHDKLAKTIVVKR